MNTHSPDFGENKRRDFPLGNILANSWMAWAVFFFFVASLFGLAMRYFFIGELPYFEYKHLLHSHSHIALLGWGFLLVSGVMVFSFVKDRSRIKIYKRLLLLSIIANIGMMLSFPIQGYGPFSIAFSTIQLLAGYLFAYHFLRDLIKSESTSAIQLIKYSVYWMLLSSIGLWAIGPIGATLGRLHPLYFMSVQWFLHFQLNGWFAFALLGLILHFASLKTKVISINRISFFILNISLFLTYALAVSWSTPIPSLFYINAVGVLLQGLAYYLILRPSLNEILPIFKFPNVWVDRLIYLGVLSLILKAVTQIALVIPEVATIAYTIRMYVIGFVHMVMLGAITFGIGGIAIKYNWLPTSNLSKLGWSLLSFGFISSEILLLGQGTLLWAKMGFIPHYHLLIFIASCFFPIALLMFFLDILRIKNKMNPNQLIKRENKFSINKQTMKSSVLMSVGVALLLLTSCGGSGGENQGAYTPPSETKEKVADPKGVGEIKQVDLGNGIDEAMANKGKAIMDMKCTACHQYNDKRIVGPGFEGVTNRRRPEWIMNMITNVDVMLDEDPVAQALLEECLTRMPNQNISIGDSRDILEYLRKNDLERTGSSDAAVK
ncbi:cytochrome c [Cyclobacteriaceae bacterium YHN15]|nr:cytochrome c [Cyclobacteriaceae bacterium YHN15]